MPETIAFPPLQGPMAERLLTGLTAPAVEDSRYACEALRLLCSIAGRGSGGRIRWPPRIGICASTGRIR